MKANPWMEFYFWMNIKLFRAVLKTTEKMKS